MIKRPIKSNESRPLLAREGFTKLLLDDRDGSYDDSKDDDSNNDTNVDDCFEDDTNSDDCFEDDT